MNVTTVFFPSIFTRMETAFVENEIQLIENNKKFWIELHNEDAAFENWSDWNVSRLDIFYFISPFHIKPKII